MATNFVSCDQVDEDYIDMEMNSHNNILCQDMSSPPHPFEFQMFSSSSERDTTTSPADELFYKGKLLPLHLPPRLQMVEKLLQSCNSYEKYTDTFDEIFSTPFDNNTPASNTPFESCNISPSESCPVSGELNPDEYFVEYPNEERGFIADHEKKSWTKKLNLIKQSSLGSKLKASRAYVKSLFSKSGCSNVSSAAASVSVNGQTIPMTKECISIYRKVSKNNLAQIQRSRNQKSASRETTENGGGHHRRSFSGAIKRFSSTKSSSFSCSSGSSSSSSNSSTSNETFKRSISSNFDIENSIQSAIAHCKSSHQQLHSSKRGSDMGFCSLSASRIIHEDQDRQELCRG